jgi:hypothetical protein
MLCVCVCVSFCLSVCVLLRRCPGVSYACGQVETGNTASNTGSFKSSSSSKSPPRSALAPLAQPPQTLEDYKMSKHRSFKTRAPGVDGKKDGEGGDRQAQADESESDPLASAYARLGQFTIMPGAQV